MKHPLKQNFKYRAIGFFIVTIFALSIFSCRKENHYHNCICSHNCNCNCNVNKNNYQDYFIAHAGGNIDGINYTNCLEALDLSYSKGCKLFELDLMVTSDGKYVAAHDWEHYKKITGYLGIIDDKPLTEEEFLSLKIHGKYTPMNMDRINLWFQNHRDAILVTDKTNNPEKIYNDFRFRDRIIMELSLWSAIDKAIELGIKPMANEYLIFAKSRKKLPVDIEPVELKSDDELEQIFKEKGIEYICMGRYCISGRENFLRRLKNNGIKNYVYHLQEPINGQPAEEYVWNYEMNFCYGMYANNLDLLHSLLINLCTTQSPP